MRSGHTLAELMVAIGLTGVVLAALAATRFGPGWSGADPLAESPEVTSLQTQLRKLVVEVQEATRLVYPLPGAGPRDGLAVVNVDGETVLYFVEQSADGRQSVRRVNVNARRLAKPDAESVWLTRVKRFRASVPAASPGKLPSLVELDIAVEVPGRAGSAPRVVSRVTALYPRNLEPVVPDDVFPPGTPLVEPRPAR